MIPSLTTAQMIEVDRAMIEDYHIELIQMMENAGRNFAELARQTAASKNVGAANIFSGNFIQQRGTTKRSERWKRKE